MIILRCQHSYFRNVIRTKCTHETEIKLYDAGEGLPINGDGATGYLYGRNVTESLPHTTRKNQFQMD